MIEFFWSAEKNNLLKADGIRGICFEDMVSAIESGGLHQRILVVLFSGYVYAVPYVRQDDGARFLKTVYPSRALRRFYLMGDLDER